MSKLHILLIIPLIILLFIIFAPPIGYNLVKEREVIPQKVYLSEQTHKNKLLVKSHKVIQKSAKYPGAAIKYKELNQEYLLTKEKPIQYNPLYFDNGKISVELLPWGLMTEKDAALGFQIKIIY